VRLSDYRLKSQEDLKLHQNFEPLKLHCPNGLLEINATNFEVWESERLSVKRIVEETSIDQLNEMSMKMTNESQNTKTNYA
jgi:hypothetical protein